MNSIAASRMKLACLALVFSCLGFLSSAVQAQTTVAVDNVWSRAQIAGRHGAVYLTLTGREGGDRMIGASSPVATKVELHETVMEGGVMKMREVPALAIPSGAIITLQPSGLHIMLLNLKQPLKEGESVPLTLVFEKAGEVATTAQVTKAGAMAPGPDHGHHGHSHR